MKRVTAWFASWRRRNPYRYGVDKHRSAWDTTHSDTDLLGHMIAQEKRRTGLPRKGMLP